MFIIQTLFGWVTLELSKRLTNNFNLQKVWILHLSYRLIH